MMGIPQPSGGFARLFARLEIIDDEEPLGAALNMATDEALLESLAGVPLLRMYRWRQEAVSFGYFDQVAPVRSGYPEHEIVRRWTGGGVVEHGQDFTYSLLVPRDHRLTALRSEDSYRLLHGVVALAIAAAASPLIPLIEAHQPQPGATAQTSRECFVNPVRHDLLLAGHKIAGAAQRRTRRGWLQQGSVRIPGETESLYRCLRRTLPTALGEAIQVRSVRPEERDAARQLVEAKYGADAWTHRF